MGDYSVVSIKINDGKFVAVVSGVHPIGLRWVGLQHRLHENGTGVELKSLEGSARVGDVHNLQPV